MKTIDVSEAKGATLNWLVAKCAGLEVEVKNTDGKSVVRLTNHHDMFSSGARKWVFEPSTDWSQGGPIIEREKIGIREWSTKRLPDGWFAGKGCGEPDAPMAEGQTLLIAAMRCYVVSKLGEEVEVPEELT